MITGGTEIGFSTGTRAVLAAETLTQDDGIAHLSVLDGDALAGTYRIRVLPPAGSNAGILYDEPLALPPPASLRLPPRVAVRGNVVDVAGEPLGDVSITARRSLRFLWSLDAADQAFLDEIPAATAITPETGEFVIWIDPSLATIWGHYDLYFETPDNSHAPNWLIPDFAVPRIPGQTAISLDTVTIPDAARIRARIVNPDGSAVEGSALRVFRIADNQALCSEVTNAPAECSDDAKVMGHGESDDSGIVRLTLPRP